MPEAIAPSPVAATQTKLQADIAAKTAAAVQDTGFDAGFDAEVEAALKADDAARTAAQAPAAAPKPKDTPPATKTPPAAKETPAKAKPATPDIPEALLSKKKADGETSGDAATDPEREKFIKEQTAGLSPKAADRFRAIEAKAHAAEQKAKRAEALEKNVSELQEKLKSATDNGEVKALREQLEKLDEIVQKNALTEHPKFKAAFDNQIADKVAIAKKQVGDEKAAAEVEALLSLPETAQRNRRLNEILGELEPVEQGKFSKAIADVDELNAKKTAELNNWRINKTKLSEMAAAEAEQATAAKQMTVDAALKLVLPKFTDNEKGIELFRTVEGNDEWNKSVEERIENVKKIVSADLSKQDVAEMAAWAMGGAQYRNLFLAQRALVTKLQEEIASLRGGEPDLGAGSGDATEIEEEGSAIDAIVRIAQRAGAIK